MPVKQNKITVKTLEAEKQQAILDLLHKNKLFDVYHLLIDEYNLRIETLKNIQKAEKEAKDEKPRIKKDKLCKNCKCDLEDGEE